MAALTSGATSLTHVHENNFRSSKFKRMVQYITSGQWVVVSRAEAQAANPLRACHPYFTPTVPKAALL